MNHYITFKEKRIPTELNLFGETEEQTIRVIKKQTVYWNISEEKENKLRAKNETINSWIKELGENIPKTYETFRIPKKSGGYRTIESPQGLLRIAQTRLKAVLETATEAHDAAYAYVKHRGIRDCVEQHQKNESVYYLHIDLKDFFGSCSREFVFRQLAQIMPFSLLDQELLKKKLEVAFKETDGLPQGAPTSPVLSNIIMIPIDFKIEKMLNELKYGFVYTRYADDIIISNKTYFNYKTVIKKIKTRLADTPLKINEEKTHFGTNRGRNWILGMMLNKDNNITIGHYTKETFRVYTFRTLTKLKTNQITAFETSKYLGLISYYNEIEKDYAKKVIGKYARKLNLTKEEDDKPYITVLNKLKRKLEIA